MEPLLSVIIPVYNVEPYLRRCVDSVLNQTYRNLEVILVDDGSPDGCGAICDEYVAKDSRVRVIHKANGGLSDARNAGMAQMTGEYLTFVDSDDWLDDQALEYLYQAMTESNADLVIGQNDRVEDGTGRVLQEPKKKTDLIQMELKEAIQHTLQQGCAAWARLYRKEIHAGIEFPVNEINEDEAIVLQLLERCHTVAEIGQVVYHYRCRPESITTSSFSTKKLVWPKHCRDNLAFIRENYPELELDAAARYRGSLLWALTEIAASEGDYSAEAESLLRDLRQNAAVFHKAPFQYPSDRLRLRILLRAPFSVYRMLVRWKGRWRHG